MYKIFGVISGIFSGSRYVGLKKSELDPDPEYIIPNSQFKTQTFLVKIAFSVPVAVN